MLALVKLTVSLHIHFHSALGALVTRKDEEASNKKRSLRFVGWNWWNQNRCTFIFADILLSRANMIAGALLLAACCLSVECA